MTCFKLLMRSFLFLTIYLVGARRDELYEDLVQSSLHSVANLNEAVSNFVLQLAEMSKSLAEVKMNQEQIKNSLGSLEQRIVHLEQTRAKIEDVKKEVVIVSGEQEAGNDKCMKVCAGSTGRSKTDWYDYSSDGLYYDVDISDCGFITIPTVTTSVEGSSNHFVSLGTSSIYNSSPTTFRIYLKNTYMNPQGGAAESRKWNIEWIAVGYTC